MRTSTPTGAVDLVGVDLRSTRGRPSAVRSPAPDAQCAPLRGAPQCSAAPCRGGLYIRPRQLRDRKTCTGAYTMRPYTKAGTRPLTRHGSMRTSTPTGVVDLVGVDLRSTRGRPSAVRSPAPDAQCAPLRGAPQCSAAPCRGGLYIRPRQLRDRKTCTGAYTMRPYINGGTGACR